MAARVLELVRRDPFARVVGVRRGTGRSTAPPEPGPSFPASRWLRLLGGGDAQSLAYAGMLHDSIEDSAPVLAEGALDALRLHPAIAVAVCG